jgi:hypothetical protein
MENIARRYNMLLAYMDPVSNDVPFDYKHWAGMARDVGITMDYPDFGGSTAQEVIVAWARAWRLLKEADAFIVESPGFFETQPSLAERFHQRIRDGARAIIRPIVGHVTELEWWYGFLVPYDLAATTVNIVGAQGNRLDVSVKRSDDSFRHPALFAGIEEVIIDTPGAIWYGGESWPVLVASEAHRVVEATPDWPADWNARELACMAAWYGENGGAVLAVLGQLFSDPCSDHFGQERLGIRRNERLAANVLRFLSEGKRVIAPEDRCQRIEINLADFTFGVLKAADQDWWTQFVPLPIRQKCATRQEEENNRLPREAYFDLIDLKSVLHKNWKLFESYFRLGGCEGGKDRALAWMDQLNELRRLAGHPLKKHISGYSFSRKERDFLEQCDGRAMKLLDASKSETFGSAGASGDTR